MTFSRHATVNYAGTIMEGKGTAAAGSGAFSVPVSFPRRIGEPEGVTSPEELVAAAHATCYAMVVTGALGRTPNAAWTNLAVTCTITADKGDAGIRLKTSKLEVTAEGLKGMDAAAFDALAKAAEGSCPISITLRPSLAIEVITHVK
jgi:osmotically inducible protein OsmC